MLCEFVCAVHDTHHVSSVACAVPRPALCRLLMHCTTAVVLVCIMLYECIIHNELVMHTYMHLITLYTVIITIYRWIFEMLDRL